MGNVWDSLLFVKEITFTPNGKNPSQPSIENEVHDYWVNSYSCIERSSETNIRFGSDWTMNYVGDYPEEFKKLAQRLGRPLAYEAYQALQKVVKDDWEDNAKTMEDHSK